jgi:hypothetical protein
MRDYTTRSIFYGCFYGMGLPFHTASRVLFFGMQRYVVGLPACFDE